MERAMLNEQEIEQFQSNILPSRQYGHLVLTTTFGKDSAHPKCFYGDWKTKWFEGKQE
jgi:hypothetical protein